MKRLIHKILKESDFDWVGDISPSFSRDENHIIFINKPLSKEEILGIFNLAKENGFDFKYDAGEEDIHVRRLFRWAENERNAYITMKTNGDLSYGYTTDDNYKSRPDYQTYRKYTLDDIIEFI